MMTRSTDTMLISQASLCRLEKAESLLMTRKHVWDRVIDDRRKWFEDYAPI
jgi:hypothetical protein